MTVLDRETPDPIIITDAKYDIIERDGSEKLEVNIFIKDVIEDSLQVDFHSHSLVVKFQTWNKQFHEKHGSTNRNRLFIWEAKLIGEVVPEDCRFKITQSKIILTLLKTTKQKWEALIPPPESNAIATTSSAPIRNEPPAENEGSLERNVRAEPVMNGNFKPMKSKRVGFTGLDNIGNTCYLNSVIQCLVNTREFKEYFEQPTLMSEINKTNPLGMQGACALNFSALLRKLWKSDEYSIAPTKLKDLIGGKVPQFAGHMQHDAQELFTFLLDAIHEDLNRVKCKPYIEDKEDCEKSDAERAREAWNKYRMRNDSVVVDWMHGQFKSSLICPQCNRKSVTFDPFVSLSVPIPPLPIIFAVHLFFINPDRQPEKHYVEVFGEPTGYELKLALSNCIGIPLKRLEIIDVCDGEIRSVIRNDVYVRNTNFLAAYELLEDDVEHYLVFQRLLKPTTTVSRNCSNCRCTLLKVQAQCPRCKVGYCSETCRNEHVTVHVCKKVKYRFVSVPFVIAMPCGAFSLRQIQSEVLRYTKNLVKIVPHKIDLDLNSNESLEDRETNFFFMKCLQENGDPIGQRFVGESIQPQTRYLSIDWRCNEESTIYCEIEEKQIKFIVVGMSSRGQLTLHDCLQLFHEPETLTKDEAWYCPSCKEHVQATKQMSIWSVPKVLVIHLKRFSFKTSYQRNKVDTFVDFPLTGLDLRPFVHTDSESTIYDLYGVVNHRGSIYGGHYTAYARLPSAKTTDFSEVGWRLFDDSMVDSVQENEIVAKDAYLLFYTRRDSRCSSSNLQEMLPSPFGNSDNFAVFDEFESEGGASASETEDYKSMD